MDSRLIVGPAQWTRFANHVCEGFNVVPRPVYVDEGDVTRPLWVYFASKHILVRQLSPLLARPR